VTARGGPGSFDGAAARARDPSTDNVNKRFDEGAQPPPDQSLRSGDALLLSIVNIGGEGSCEGTASW